MSTGTADDRALARAADDAPPPLPWDVEVEVDARVDDAPSIPRDVLDTLVDLLLLLILVLDAMDLVSEFYGIDSSATTLVVAKHFT